MTAPGDSAGIFDASAAAAGYAMQIRYALYRAVQRLKTGLDWQIGLEVGDDIEVVTAAGYKDYLQIKHRDEAARLTDASSDLWKSLRIWSTGVADGTIEIETAQLFLVSTGQASSGSAASLLGPAKELRDIPAALRILDTTAAASTNRANQTAYAAWKALDEGSRTTLVNHVTIVCDAPDIDDVKRLLEEEVSISVRRSHLQAFVADLEGWWFQRCITMFRSSEPDYVLGEEFDAEFSHLRESFLPENLPVDPDVPQLNPGVDGFSDYLFVQQIGLVQINQGRLASAVRDYFRAYTQRSRWTRQNLVGPGELADYERKLFEEWKYQFDRLTDDLPGEASEEAKINMARQIYAWVEDGLAPPIRRQFTERFVVRGSLHMLADRMDSGVGWHPDFAMRLMALFEPVKAAP